MYKITYLPVARQDITDIILYISDHLKAPQAATNLLSALEYAISSLREFPYAYKIYRTVKPLDAEYRMLPVNNFAVFYVVLEQEKAVEVRRVPYVKANLNKYFG